MAGANIGNAFVTIMPSTKGISGSIKNALSGEATSAGESAGKGLGSSLVSTLKKVVAAAGIATLIKESLFAGGDLQQSFGGLETLYGDAAEAAKNYAKEAYQAGLSSNEYAEQAVSFGAALKEAYGGDMTKAVEAANTAIMDMADNSAKMGTDIGLIQNAYQGFAKQNYTMLDNLKLGYGGTKSEMERLLQKANEINAQSGKMTDYQIDNLGDVYEAIHVVQEDLGLTGVAAQEAGETFTGSLGAMKAALTNFMASLSLGEDIQPALMALLETVENFLFNNLFPMIGNIMSALPGVLGELLLQAFQAIPGVVDSAIAFLTSLSEGITEGSPVLYEKLTEIGNAAIEMFKNTDWIGLGSAVLNLLVTGLGAVASIVWDALKAIGAKAAEWFKSVDWADVGSKAVTFIRDGISKLGSLIWEAVKSIGQTAWEWFKNIDWEQAGHDAMDFIINGIKGLASLILDTIKSIAIDTAITFTNIDWADAGTKALDFITTAAKGEASFLWGAIQSIAETAVEWFTGIDWLGVGSTVIDYIVSGLASFGSNVWNKLKEIGETAWDWITGIDWWSVGSDIVNGIVNGITSMGASIANTLLSFAESAWNAVVSFFDIGSPSKLMKNTVGRWIPLGIAEGIETEGDSVAEAITDVAKSSIDGFDATIGMDSHPLAIENAPTGILGGITINVYPAEGMDEIALADRVSDRLEILLEQEEAVWGTA